MERAPNAKPLYTPINWSKGLSWTLCLLLLGSIIFIVFLFTLYLLFPFIWKWGLSVVVI